MREGCHEVRREKRRMKKSREGIKKEKKRGENEEALETDTTEAYQL